MHYDVASLRTSIGITFTLSKSCSVWKERSNRKNRRGDRLDAALKEARTKTEALGSESNRE